MSRSALSPARCEIIFGPAVFIPQIHCGCAHQSENDYTQICPTQHFFPIPRMILPCPRDIARYMHVHITLWPVARNMFLFTRAAARAIQPNLNNDHIARSLRMSIAGQYRGTGHQCARARVVQQRPLRAVYTASQQLNCAAYCAQYAGVHVACNVPRSFTAT